MRLPCNARCKALLAPHIRSPIRGYILHTLLRASQCVTAHACCERTVCVGCEPGSCVVHLGRRFDADVLQEPTIYRVYEALMHSAEGLKVRSSALPCTCMCKPV